jgi:diadenosine tetraphosphate (Ap4A) HIT family hydrolase
MTLTPEQEKQVKEQLLKQVEQFPEENREQIKEQINSMTTEQLEEFIKQNELKHMEGDSGCIFCNIVEGKSPSLKVDENEFAIAILDINPISRGHVLIIPKDHKAEASQELQEFAFAVGGKILSKLNPKDITTQGSKVADHTILNVIPIYEDTDLKKRIKVSEKELVEVQKILASPGMLREEKSELIKSITKPNKTKEEISIDESCIFCMIAQGKIQSIKLDENASAIAVLELTPLTKGHTLIIPKEHLPTTKIPTASFTLAKKIAKKLKSRFKANDVKILTKEIGEHAILDVIPIYDDPNPEKREPADSKELENVAKKLRPKPRKTPASKKNKKKSSGLPQFSARIP